MQTPKKKISMYFSCDIRSNLSLKILNFNFEKFRIPSLAQLISCPVSILQSEFTGEVQVEIRILNSPRAGNRVHAGTGAGKNGFQQTKSDMEEEEVIKLNSFYMFPTSSNGQIRAKINETSIQLNNTRLIEIPIRYCDLSFDSIIEFRLFIPFSPFRKIFVGVCRVRIFDEKGVMVSGQKLLMLRNKNDGKQGVEEIYGGKYRKQRNEWNMKRNEEISRIRGLYETLDKEKIKNSWEKLFWNWIEKSEKFKPGQIFNSNTIDDSLSSSASFRSTSCRGCCGGDVSMTVYFSEMENGIPVIHRELKQIDENEGGLKFSLLNKSISVTQLRKRENSMEFPKNKIIFEKENISNKRYVEEYDKVNPFEMMQIKLSIGKLRAMQGNDSNVGMSSEGGISLQEYSAETPNVEEEKLLEEVKNTTCVQELTIKQKQIVYKFKDYKMSDADFLTKFLDQVDWVNEQARKEGLKYLRLWKGIKIHNILELLSDKYKHVKEVRSYAVDRLYRLKEGKVEGVLLQLCQALRYEEKGEIATSGLAKFLYEKSRMDFNIASKLYWIVNTEKLDTLSMDYRGEEFESFQLALVKNLNRNIIDRINRQVEFFDFMVQACKDMKESKMNLVQKKSYLRRIVEKKCENGWDIFPFSLPLKPEIQIAGIESPKINVLNSNAQPIVIPFITTTNRTFEVMFKDGDDLRQDQLIIQILKTINQLFNSNKVSLELTKYEVVACSPSAGFVEMVTKTTSLQKIRTNGNNIRAWLKKKNETSSRYRKAIANFIKTCATYTCISYVFGFGDRHLDNILMKSNGNLFHIDFGYILGNTTGKFFEAKIKMNNLMWNAIGVDPKDENFKLFFRVVFKTYDILRNNANLVVTLFLLMIDSGINDVVNKKRNNKYSNIEIIPRRLRLNQKKNEAEEYIKTSIIQNSRSFSGALEDRFHDVGKLMKK